MGHFFSSKPSWTPKTQPNDALRRRLVEFLVFNSVYWKKSVPSNGVNRVRKHPIPLSKVQSCHNRTFCSYWSNQSGLLHVHDLSWPEQHADPITPRDPLVKHNHRRTWKKLVHYMVYSVRWDTFFRWTPKTQPDDALRRRLVEFFEFKSAFGWHRH